jgi:mRNA-degrading endonuclease toxin of MazEF toxin-antitoxin module
VNPEPKRGEIWIVNWNPSRGSEQAGKRPALVIQNDITHLISQLFDFVISHKILPF